MANKADKSGSFTATSQDSGDIQVFGPFNVILSNTGVATIEVQWKPAGGSTYYPVPKDVDGTPLRVSYGGSAKSVAVTQDNFGGSVRLFDYAHTSGQVDWQVVQ